MTPRQLIVCCDGTNNNLTGGSNDTNVTKLCELLDPEAQGQVLFYDPGVGNPGQLPGATWSDSISRRYERLRGLAFGKGVYENIADAYLFLMRHYQEGDQVFLYGFSRGAFTARSIGGLVTSFGLLRPEMEGLVPTLLHVYFSDRQEAGIDYDRVRAQITALFGAGQARHAPIWFVGVWDTVASVGAPFLSREITGSPTIVGKRFHHVRQALALDEYRLQFKPRPYYIDPAHDYTAAGQSIGQLWFAGAHCDIGGGYSTPEARLSNEALQWMLVESVACGLRLPSRLLDAAGRVDATAVLQLQRTTSVASTLALPRVHSETYDTPWWALTGLRVRDMDAVQDATGKQWALKPQEHASVESLRLEFDEDTVWRRTRSPLGLVAAALLGLFFAVLAGQMLTGAVDLRTMSIVQASAALLKDLPDAWNANAGLAWWQLAWVLHGPPLQSLPAFKSVTGAIFADFGLIAAYGYLISRGVTWGFARVARLRRVKQRPSAALNRLGLSAPVAVAADVAENFLTLWLVLGYPSTLAPWSEWLVGMAMTTASLVKWAGLLGCAELVIWGALSRPARTATE
jgi:uncharacterized protein (DUF2235 family)